MKKIELREVEKILKQASDSYAEYVVEQHKDKFNKMDKQINDLEKMKTNLSLQMKEIRLNWNTLEDNVKSILNIDEKIDEIKEIIKSQDPTKLDNSDLLQKNIKDATIQRNGLISNYFQSLGSIGKKAHNDFKHQLESESNKQMRFTPLHNIILQAMDQNKVEVQDKIYNLKRGKTEDMHGIKATSPFFEAFLKEWKKSIENGEFPQVTKKLVLNNNQPEQFVNSMYFSLVFLTDAIGYDAKKLTPQFIENEISNKAYELKGLIEDININKKLSKKLSAVIVEGDMLFSKSLSFKKDEIKDFESEVKKSLENPQAYPPEITKDRIDTKILKQYCKVDLLKESLTAVIDTNRLLQREKSFEKSPAFDMFG